MSVRAGVLFLLLAVAGLLVSGSPVAAPAVPAVSSGLSTGLSSVPSTGSTSAPSVGSTDAPVPDAADRGDRLPFDPDAVTAELLARPVVVLPGSIARFDQDRVGALTGGGTVKILVAPPGPLDAADNRAYRSALADVAQSVEDQWDGTVVRITGVGVQSVGQSGLADVRFLLSTFDVTDELEFVTPYLQGGETGPNKDRSVVDRSDPAVVADLIARLRQTRVVITEPAADSFAVADPERLAASWSNRTGTGLRLVIAPPLTAGDSAAVTAADLAPAFPDEAVVLLQGRWLDVAGPDRTAWTVARDMTLSRYEDFLEGRQIGPAELLGVLADQYAELTSGAVQDQPTPTQRNPVSWLLLILPLLALVVVVVFAVRRRSRTVRRASDARHRDVAGLAAAAADLPALAEGILALDGLARTGAARDRLAEATRAYRSARRLVDARDGAGATAAVRDAGDALTDVADRIGVPNVPGTRARAGAAGPA
ncbi:hypothetical protein [Nakamurella sp.]|uniref:hypothetical protein n=1 Tax=Nakamurella sp. TaxID=1869182 RepID=UPI00378372A5